MHSMDALHRCPLSKTWFVSKNMPTLAFSCVDRATRVLTQDYSLKHPSHGESYQKVL